MSPSEIEALVAQAGGAMKNSLATCSGFSVGAALLTTGGKMYTGSNIENPSVMLTTCAERVALQKALSEGERSFSAMAIVSSAKERCFPCGVCRQMLFEYAPELDIFLASNRGVFRYKIKELLPHPFIRDVQ